MKQIVKALIGQRVSIVYKGESPDNSRVGIVQSILGDKATIDDCFGGAYWLPISEITAIRIDTGLEPVIVLANWHPTDARNS